MKGVLLALLATILACGSAGASEKSGAMDAVNKWVDGFNKGDFKAMVAMCADNAVVIDDIPPHVWQSCAKWLNAYQAFSTKETLVAGNVALGKPKHFDAEASYAYLVVPVTFTYSKAGKPTKTTAVVTMSLHKGSSGWLITGWAWADQES
jgi:ketosteroid isomerase-like protein